MYCPGSLRFVKTEALDAVLEVGVIQIVRLSRHEHAPRPEQHHAAGLHVVQARADLEADAYLVGVEPAQDARQAAFCAVELGGYDLVPGGERLRYEGQREGEKERIKLGRKET